MERAARRAKRGPYKRYLKDPRCAIPKTSWWRVRRHNRNTSRSDPPEPRPTEIASSSAETMLGQNERAVCLNEATPDQDTTTIDPHEIVSSPARSQDGSLSDLPSSEDDVDSLAELFFGVDDASPPTELLSNEVDTSISFDTLSDKENLHTEDSSEPVNSYTKVKNLFDPIYKDASITLCGAFCAIMEFKRSCRLPFTSIDKLLDLLQLLCPPDNALPKTLHEIKKFFGAASDRILSRKFCPTCDMELQVKQKYCDVDTCKKKEPSTLVVLDLAKSINRVLKRNWEYVSSGKCGIAFNTDGISPFKSSNLTVWPVIFALNALPPRIRWYKDNLVVMAFWVGEKKPPMDILFSPLTDAFGTLSKFGIKLCTPVGEKNITFELLFGSFDFVAKAPILNMHQFNGKYGCPSCLNPGVSMASRYYLPDRHYDLRTNNSIVANANEANSKGEIINGIKGHSVLSGVVDLVKGIPIDYMHCVLEGVVKWLLEKWFTSKNHGEPFYIGTSVNSIDSLLLSQRPPHEFSRAPRSIAKTRKLWKASEFRTWLLYYSLPLLVSSKMPPLYIHHFALLVCAIHILLKAEIIEIQILAAEELLKDFYLMLPSLYGPRSCTLNAHSLIHLCMYVRLWGPLWTHSLFGYESLNGHLTSMIHSRYKVAEQLSFSLEVIQTIGNLADKLVEVEDENTIDFISPMSSLISKRHNMMLILPGFYSIGKLKVSSLTDEESHAMQEATGISVRQINSFHKLYFNDCILHSSQFDKGKRNSSVCSYTCDDKVSYGEVQQFSFSPPIAFIRPFKRTMSSILKRTGNPGRDRLRKYADTDLISCFFVEVYNHLLPVHAVLLSDLKTKCAIVSLTSHSYVIQIPNNYEHQ